jgi:hypothetical protein
MQHLPHRISLLLSCSIRASSPSVPEDDGGGDGQEQGPRQSGASLRAVMCGGPWLEARSSATSRGATSAAAYVRGVPPDAAGPVDAGERVPRRAAPAGPRARVARSGPPKDIRRLPRSTTRGCSLISGPRLPTNRAPSVFSGGATGERSGALVRSKDEGASRFRPGVRRRRRRPGRYTKIGGYLQTRVLSVKI